MKYKFEDICNEMIELQERKDHDYGGAYYSNLDDEKLAAARLAIGNKWKRFKHLSIEGNNQVKESLEDTLIDMACYAIMTIQWLRENEF